MTDELKGSLSLLPPLRIYHFLLAMACIAVVAAYQSWSGTLVFGSAYREIVAEAFRAVTGILQSLAALALFLLLKWRYRDRVRFQIEPGHWLLLIVSIEFLLTAILSNLYLQLGDHEDYGNLFLVFDLLFRILPQLLVAGVCAAAYGASKAKAWRRFFFTCLFISLCGAIWLSLQLLPPGVMGGAFEFDWLPWWLYQPTTIFAIPTLQLVLIALAIRDDKISHIGRHWTHWCGVITWAGILGAFALMRTCFLVPFWFT